MPLSKEVRLLLFLDALTKAPPADDAQSAFTLLCAELNRIEDCHSGAKPNPKQWERDGRMYPPQADQARPVEGFPSITVYRNRGHRTFIASNGAIEIQELSGKTILEKRGKNGLTVQDTTTPDQSTGN